MGQPAVFETRAITLELGIRAEPSAVWRALTDAAELTRWFPLEAEVRPGVGGSMRLSWGDPVVADWRIDCWNPARRLLVSEIRPLGILLQPQDQVAPTRMVDFPLDTQGGTTRLRIVHAGFGGGPSWDEVFFAVRRGWQFQLCSLQHYLERHVGAERTVARMRHTLPLSAEQAWSRLTGEGGLLAAHEGETFEKDWRCRLSIGAAEKWSGVIQIFDPPRQMAIVIAGMNDALFRIYIVETAPNQVELSSWLASYGVSRSVVEAFELQLTEALGGLLTRDARFGTALPPSCERPSLDLTLADLLLPAPP